MCMSTCVCERERVCACVCDNPCLPASLNEVVSSSTIEEPRNEVIDLLVAVVVIIMISPKRRDIKLILKKQNELYVKINETTSCRARCNAAAAVPLLLL